ncbi:nuclear transport factor 2 family protein [Granulicella cerasi]|uniref:Nuclear transport factor 2 family protein n=1 Tax=Granulicella cerasi TaxID=741063 RepID=A0ABW1Z5L7_9BACT|nr:nuclear transport factor 2 family protein [Granulicella cerasi]
MNEESDEATIRRTRDNSNRAIARRNLAGVGASLAEDYVGIIGDGTFVASRAEYLRLYKQGFDQPKHGLTYVRTPDAIHVAEDHSLAAEHGRWVATLPSGEVVYTGVYSAMWRNAPSGWMIRTETFVTLES